MKRASRTLKLPRGRSLALDRTVIMGILNATDDSFYPDSRVTAESLAETAGAMLASGADILDIGAESTRPGSHGVDEATEASRLIPAIEELRRSFPDAVISADTRKPSIAALALSSGADIVNDVSGGADGGTMRAAADAGAPYVLMHTRGTPATMQQNASYDDVLAEIALYFEERLALAMDCGLPAGQVILDPGIGFAKGASHNLTILGNLDYFEKFGCPIMVGASRKATIGKVLGLDSPSDRLEGTMAITSVSAWLGADIIRVHDVAENARAARMADAIREARR